MSEHDGALSLMQVGAALRGDSEAVAVTKAAGDALKSLAEPLVTAFSAMGAGGCTVPVERGKDVYEVSVRRLSAREKISRRAEKTPLPISEKNLAQLVELFNANPVIDAFFVFHDERTPVEERVYQKRMTSRTAQIVAIQTDGFPMRVARQAMELRGHIKPRSAFDGWRAAFYALFEKRTGKPYHELEGRKTADLYYLFCEEFNPAGAVGWHTLQFKLPDTEAST